MNSKTLKALMKLKTTREHGLRYRIASIDKREAQLSIERHRAIENGIELRAQREALFAAEPVVEPRAFALKRVQLSDISEKARAARERVTQIDADLQACHGEREARTEELKRTLRGQEKLAYLLGGRYGARNSG